MLKLKLFTAIFISLFIFSASEVIQVHVFDHNDLYLFGQEYEVESLEKYEISSELAFEDHSFTASSVQITEEEASEVSGNLNIDIDLRDVKANIPEEGASEVSGNLNIDIDLRDVKATIPNVDIDVTKEEENKPSRRRRSSRNKDTKSDIDIDLTQVQQGSVSSEGTIPDIDIDVSKVNGTIPNIDIDVTKEEEVKPSRRRRSSRSKETNIDIDLTKEGEPTEDENSTVKGQRLSRSRGERVAKAVDIDVDLMKAEDQRDSVKVDIDENLKKEGDVVDEFEREIEKHDEIVGGDDDVDNGDGYDLRDDVDGDLDD